MEINIKTLDRNGLVQVRVEVPNKGDAIEMTRRLLGGETGSFNEVTELRGQRDQAWARIEFLKETVDRTVEKNAGLAEKLRVANTAAQEQRDITVALERRLHGLTDKLDTALRIANHGNVSDALHSAEDGKALLAEAIREIRQALNA